MNILFDTNVILDVMLDWAPFCEPASSLLSLVEKGDIKGSICATTVTTIHYLAAKGVGQIHAQKQIKNLIAIFSFTLFKCMLLKKSIKSFIILVNVGHHDEVD